MRPGLTSGSIVCVRALASSDAIGGEVSARRPSQMPDDPGDHPPARDDRHDERVAVACQRSERHGRKRGGGARAEQHRRPQELGEPHLSGSTVASTYVCDQQREQLLHPGGPVDDHVGLLGDLRRPLVGADADADRAGDAALLLELGQRPKRVDVGRVVADVHDHVDVDALQERDDPGALVHLHRRANLEHLASPVRAQPRRLGLGRERVDCRPRGFLVGRAAPVERDDRALVLEPHPPPPQIRCVGFASELVDPPDPVLDARVEHRLGPSGPQQLGPMGPQIRDRPDRDHRAGFRCPTSADARDDAVAAGDLDQQLARALGHVRIGGVLDDRGERAVDVEQNRAVLWIVAKRG